MAAFNTLNARIVPATAARTGGEVRVQRSVAPAVCRLSSRSSVALFHRSTGAVKMGARVSFQTTAAAPKGNALGLVFGDDGQSVDIDYDSLETLEAVASKLAEVKAAVDECAANKTAAKDKATELKRAAEKENPFNFRGFSGVKSTPEELKQLKLDAATQNELFLSEGAKLPKLTKQVAALERRLARFESRASMPALNEKIEATTASNEAARQAKKALTKAKAVEKVVSAGRSVPTTAAELKAAEDALAAQVAQALARKQQEKAIKDEIRALQDGFKAGRAASMKSGEYNLMSYEEKRAVAAAQDEQVDAARAKLKAVQSGQSASAPAPEPVVEAEPEVAAVEAQQN